MSDTQDDSTSTAVAQKPPKPGGGEGPPKPPPKPAMQKKAPGVRGSRHIPDETTLETGSAVGNRFFVERYLGSSGGAVSYLCNDKQTQTPVVVKVLRIPAPDKQEFEDLGAKIAVASSVDHRNLLGAVGMGRIDGGEVFVAMEYADGSTLSQLVAERREEGRTLSLRDVFTVLAHTCSALEAVHEAGSFHGVLTPYNIYVDTSGVVNVGNLALGRVTSGYQYERGEGPFVDSIYVAPEATENPGQLDHRSDLYSLGMIAAELLSPTGLPNNRKKAHDMAVDALSKYPPGLFGLISSCLSENPDQRPTSTIEFRDEFEEIARQAGARLEGTPPSGALPVEPAVGGDEEQEDEVFDLFDAAELQGPETTGSDDRYLVQKDGLDYGPFTEEEVLEQLYADEIDEHSQVLDRVTQQRRELQEFEVFRQPVLDYIPKREERLRKERERREEIKRKAKKGGEFGLVAAIIAGLVILGGMVWNWIHLPDPEPIPMNEAFASMDYHFSPPPTEFQTMEVDPDVMEGIFNPEATEEEVQQHLARARASRSGDGGGSGGTRRDQPAEEEQVTEVDLSESGSGAGHLSDNQINQVIMDDFPALRDCIMKQASRDASFTGVTVQFSIQPSGTTMGVGLKESGYESSEMGQCLIGRFRAMRFPEHGAIEPRGVEYPFHIR